MPEFETLTEVILYVEDMDRMFEFYSEVLGFRVLEGDPEHGFVKLDVGTCALCLHEGRDGPPGEYAPKLVFEVSDLEEAADHLRNHDVQVGEQRSPTPGVKVVDCLDPEENTFSMEVTGEP